MAMNEHLSVSSVIKRSLWSLSMINRPEKFEKDIRTTDQISSYVELFLTPFTQTLRLPS